MVICNKEYKGFDYYWNLKPSIVYLQDLNYIAPNIVREAEERNIKVYGIQGRTRKDNYIRCCSFGKISPRTIYIKLSTGTVLYDYNRWDTNDNVSEEEMYEVAEEIEKWFEGSDECRTATNAIQRKLSVFLNAQKDLYQIESDNYGILDNALFGGANWTKKGHFPIELHIDYHQLYAYVMSHKFFPKGKPHLEEGYCPGNMNIYRISPGSMCRLKKDGFPIIKDLGEDGEWFDAGLRIQELCDVDLNTLQQNYELKNFRIFQTLVYDGEIDGKTYFKPLVDEIYNGRIKYKGTAKARFYKTLNEMLPGYFERTYNFGFYTTGFKRSELKGHQGTKSNPKIGIFITAYARQMLNDLLHLFPYEKVIGYDTDCVFFEGTRNEIPFAVRQMMGDLPGQVHEDGYYKNTYHQASKFYWGTDYHTGEKVKKLAGVSKSGYYWTWNGTSYKREKKEKNEEPRSFTF